MKRILICFLGMVGFINLSGCAALMGTGYSTQKPNIQNLITYQSTLGEVKEELGEPASRSFIYGDRVFYKYYYKTPNAIIDSTLIAKGDFLDGCQKCGTIKAYFKWNLGVTQINNDFKLVGITVSDESLQLSEQRICRLIGQGKFTEILPEITQLANEHYTWAEHTLGLMYVNGDGVNRDYSKASYWFVRAAGADSPGGLYDLGAMYRNGEGRPANLQAAKDLYIRAGRLGYPLAIQELIKIYQSGNDTDQVKFWSGKLK